MSYTGGDDRHLDAEIEGRLSYNRGESREMNPYDYLGGRELRTSWFSGWDDERRYQFQRRELQSS